MLVSRATVFGVGGSGYSFQSFAMPFWACKFVAVSNDCSHGQANPLFDLKLCGCGACNFEFWADLGYSPNNAVAL